MPIVLHIKWSIYKFIHTTVCKPTVHKPELAINEVKDNVTAIMVTNNLNKFLRQTQLQSAVYVFQFVLHIVSTGYLQELINRSFLYIFVQSLI